MPEETNMSEETLSPRQTEAPTPPDNKKSRRDVLKLFGLAALGAGKLIGNGREPTLPMLDTQRLKEPIKTTGYNISIESGNHDYFLNKEGRNVHQETMDGQLDSHAWNPEVLERLQKRDPQVRILTIDSLLTRVAKKTNPNEKSRPDPNLSFSDAALLWSFLPGSPSQINSGGSVYVISTEQMLSGNPDVHARGSSTLFEEKEHPELRIAVEEKFREGYYQNLQHKDVEALYDISKLLAAVVGVEAVLTVLKSARGFSSTAEDKAKDLPTRRKVLGIGIKAALAAAFALKANAIQGGRHYHLEKAGNAQSIEEKNIHINQADMLSPDSVVVSDWLDARNAMYILKSKDCMDVMGEGQLITSEDEDVILVGGAHPPGMREFMESEEACDAAIQKYGKSIFAVVDKIAENDSSINVLKVKENIIRMLSSANIYNVKDASPDLPPSMRFGSAIHYTGGGISPRAFRALSQLLPEADKRDIGISLYPVVRRSEVRAPNTQSPKEDQSTQPVNVSYSSSEDR